MSIDPSALKLTAAMPCYTPTARPGASAPQPFQLILDIKVHSRSIVSKLTNMPIVRALNMPLKGPPEEMRRPAAAAAALASVVEGARGAAAFRLPAQRATWQLETPL